MLEEQSMVRLVLNCYKQMLTKPTYVTILQLARYAARHAKMCVRTTIG